MVQLDWAGLYCSLHGEHDMGRGTNPPVDHIERWVEWRIEAGIQQGHGQWRMQRERWEKESMAKHQNPTTEAADGRQPQHDSKILTYLEVYFLGCIFQGHRLLEDVTLLGQLLALRPVVESACDEHFFGGMLPRSENSPNVSSAQRLIA